MRTKVSKAGQYGLEVFTINDVSTYYTFSAAPYIRLSEDDRESAFEVTFLYENFNYLMVSAASTKF